MSLIAHEVKMIIGKRAIKTATSLSVIDFLL